MSGSAPSYRWGAYLVPALAGVLLLVVSANAWSQTTPTSRSRTQLINEVTDRRSALKKAVAASSVIGIALKGSEAEATTAAIPYNEKKVYTPPVGSLEGKVIIITGANSGLGLESAKRLAAGGGTILLTARTEAKGEKAINEVQQYLADRSVENTKIYATVLDLADLDSVKSFPKRYISLLGSKKKIDVLMNNAGVAAIPEKEMTKDGFERTFQINHLGPFVLTALLYPSLNREGSRVINVSSVAHQGATLARSTTSGLDTDNLNGELEYSGLGWPAYCSSKLENILFTQELQRRADAAGLDWLTVSALHPGGVGTDIWRNTYFGVDQRGNRRTTTGGSSIQTLASGLFFSSLLSVEEGANTQVMLAASGEQQGTPAKGQYFDEHMKLKNLSNFASDKDKARYLWDKSQELAGIEFKVN